MNWLEITVRTTPDRVDSLVDELMELGADGVVINDEAAIRDFLDNNPKAWDYVEDDVFDAVRDASSLQFYLEDSETGLERLQSFRKALPELSFEAKPVHDEDWLNNWRQFFKPIEVGSRLLIVPEWEPIPEGTDRTVLRIDPKQIFGNGSHASTRLCLEELEQRPARYVLDLGCGSGILSIAALLYGAEAAVGCDIVADAPEICRDNCRINGIPDGRLTIRVGDVLEGDNLREFSAGRLYDVVFANVGADFNIALAARVRSVLTPGGVLICSGIIDTREDEVRAALLSSGLEILHTGRMDGWSVFTARVLEPGSPL